MHIESGIKVISDRIITPPHPGPLPRGEKGNFFNHEFYLKQKSYLLGNIEIELKSMLRIISRPPSLDGRGIGGGCNTK